MKNLITIFLLFFYGSEIIAQSQCELDYAIYRNNYKQKDYYEAIKKWRKVYNNCPEYNQNIFVDGPKLYYHMIKKDKPNKMIYLDTIMMIHDSRIENFGRREYVLGNKGADLFKYDPSRYKEAYDMLQVSIDMIGNASLPNVLVAYFKSLIQCEKSQEYVTKQEVLEAYVLTTSIISYNLENNKKYEKFYQKALGNIENIFAPYASCEDLIPVFSKRLESGITDVNLLSKIINLLEKKDCTDNEVFEQSTLSLHKLSPSSSSSYNMGNISINNKDYVKAEKYFEEAIELENDISIRASYFLRLSYVYQMQGKYSIARSTVLKASELKPEWGEPYLMLGDIYASSSNKCGETALERGSLYWVAIDMYRKAKRVDNALSEKANRKIATYSKYFPSKEDCFFNDLEDGSSYKVGCWVNRTTIVRTRD